MAQVNATATIVPFAYPKGYDNTQRMEIVRGTITISAGQYPPGGFPLNWNNIEGIKAVPAAGSSPASTGNIFPIDVDIKSVANLNSTQGTGPSGYIYAWDNVLGNMHIFQVATDAASGSSGPLIEIGGGISGTIIADTIQFCAVFSRL
jgi:hypothetical protein